MGKLLTQLNKQLTTEFKKDAEDCLIIYYKLLEMENGHVWESSWRPLTSVKFVGTYPNTVRHHKPSNIGYLFLKGLEQ